MLEMIKNVFTRRRAIFASTTIFLFFVLTQSISIKEDFGQYKAHSIWQFIYQSFSSLGQKISAIDPINSLSRFAPRTFFRLRGSAEEDFNSNFYLISKHIDNEYAILEYQVAANKLNRAVDFLAKDLAPYFGQKGAPGEEEEKEKGQGLHQLSGPQGKGVLRAIDRLMKDRADPEIIEKMTGVTDKVSSLQSATEFSPPYSRDLQVVSLENEESETPKESIRKTRAPASLPTKNISAATISSSPVLEATIVPVRVSLGKGPHREASDAEFLFLADKETTSFSALSKALKLRIPIEGDQTSISGLVQTNMAEFRTRVELPLERGREQSIFSPIIEKNEYREFLNHYQANGPGGHVLVELDNETRDLDIDEAPYLAKLKLDKNFKVVDEGKPFHFVLFTAVNPGNAYLIVSYPSTEETDKRIKESITAEKLIHVVENEFLFLSLETLPPIERDLQVREKKALGKIDSPLYLKGDQLRGLGAKVSKRSAMNTSDQFRLSLPPRPLGKRVYLETGHLGSPIYISLTHSPKLIFPDSLAIEEVYREFKIDALFQRCMVQIEINRTVKEITVAAETSDGPMSFEQLILSRDGSFFRHQESEVNQEIQNTYLLGDRAGVFHIVITGTDGLKQYLTSYCHPNAYLIESKLSR